MKIQITSYIKRESGSGRGVSGMMHEICPARSGTQEKVRLYFKTKDGDWKMIFRASPYMRTLGVSELTSFIRDKPLTETIQNLDNYKSFEISFDEFFQLVWSCEGLGRLSEKTGVTVADLLEAIESETISELPELYSYDLWENKLRTFESDYQYKLSDKI